MIYKLLFVTILFATNLISNTIILDKICDGNDCVFGNHTLTKHNNIYDIPFFDGKVIKVLKPKDKISELKAKIRLFPGIAKITNINNKYKNKLDSKKEILILDNIKDNYSRIRQDNSTFIAKISRKKNQCNKNNKNIDKESCWVDVIKEPFIIGFWVYVDVKSHNLKGWVLKPYDKY
jgi:hypothetical protein